MIDKKQKSKIMTTDGLIDKTIKTTNKEELLKIFEDIQKEQETNLINFIKKNIIGATSFKYLKEYQSYNPEYDSQGLPWDYSGAVYEVFDKEDKTIGMVVAKKPYMMEGEWGSIKYEVIKKN